MSSTTGKERGGQKGQEAKIQEKEKVKEDTQWHR